MASLSENGARPGSQPRGSKGKSDRLSLPLVKAVFATMERARTPVTADHGLNGSLAEMPLPDLLQTLQTLKKSGNLLLTDGPRAATLALEHGLIIDCQHPDPAVTLGTTLIDLGIVTLEQLSAAVLCDGAAVPGGRALVTLLVELGFLTEARAEPAIRQLVERTVVEVMDWGAGRFVFEARDRLDRGEASAAAGVSPTEVVLTVLTRADEARTRAALSCSAPRPTDELVGARGERSLRRPHLTGKTVGIVCRAWLRYEVGATRARLRGMPLAERLAIGALVAVLLAVGLLLAWDGDSVVPLAENSCEPPPPSPVVSSAPATVPTKARPSKPAAVKVVTVKKAATPARAASAAKPKGAVWSNGKDREPKNAKSTSAAADK